MIFCESLFPFRDDCLPIDALAQSSNSKISIDSNTTFTDDFGDYSDLISGSTENLVTRKVNKPSLAVDPISI